MTDLSLYTSLCLKISLLSYKTYDINIQKLSNKFSRKYIRREAKSKAKEKNIEGKEKKEEDIIGYFKPHNMECMHFTKLL